MMIVQVIVIGIRVERAMGKLALKLLMQISAFFLKDSDIFWVLLNPSFTRVSMGNSIGVIPTRDMAGAPPNS